MNHILKYAIFAMAAVLSAISAYLTAVFMGGLGEKVGLMIPFAAAGVALDIIKTILPAALLIAWGNKKYYAAITGALVAVLLTGLSMMASFSSINKSVSAAAIEAISQNHVYQIALNDVSRLERSLDSVLEQQAVYLDAGMATKAAGLNGRIDSLNDKLEEANNRAKLTTKTVEQTIGNEWIAVISAIIELACITGLVVASSLTLKSSENVGTAMMQATSTTVQATSQTTMTTLQTSGQFESLDQARELIIKQSIRPSERQLANAMQIPRNHAAMLLAALERDGTLIKGTNGRVVAAESVIN